MQTVDHDSTQSQAQGRYGRHGKESRKKQNEREREREREKEGKGKRAGWTIGCDDEVILYI